MKHFVYTLGFLLFLMGAVPSLCVGDMYAAGFHTRGVAASDYLDRDDAIMSPEYFAISSKWALIPRITLTSSYENNPTLNSGVREDATTVYLVPGALLMYGRRQHNHVYLDSGLIIPVYTETEGISEKPSLMLVAGGLLQTGRSSLHGRLGYRRIENVDTLVGARIVRDDYTGDVALERRVSRKTSLGALANVGRFEYDNAAYTDYWRYYGAGRLYYRVFPRSDVYLQAGAGQDRLDGDARFAGDADFYDVSLGFRGRQTAKTSVGGNVGYRWRDARYAQGRDVEHYIAAVEASTNPLGLTRFTAGLQADIRPAIASRGFTTADQRGTLSVSRRIITERLRGQGSLFVGQIDYYGPRTAAPEEDAPTFYDGRRDEYWGYSLGLDWWTRYNFSFGISYSYFESYGARNGARDVRDLSSYDNGRWGIRGSWNY